MRNQHAVETQAIGTIKNQIPPPSEMTHEFLATMLGVQRPGVTLAVGILQKAGLVRHERGRMHILDRKGLEHAACECYGIVRECYAWLGETR